MSANVETMMYVREKPWHGLGTEVTEAPTSADALKLAGLDWNVNQEEVFDKKGIKIPGYRVNVRSSDNSILGIVGERYRIVQNVDAFRFTDNLIGGGVRYETAGSLKCGHRIWLLAKMPDKQIAGDTVEPYLCFTNSHDGSCGVKVCMTPVRVVCNNTLNVALGSAKRIWSMKHTENIHERLNEARNCLFLADSYMNDLAEYADRAANKRMVYDGVQALLHELFPESTKMSDREKANIKKCRDEFMICYFAPDLVKFRGTAWGAINAASDFLSHNMPHRNTKTYAENNWGRIMDGHILLDKAAAICMR